MDISSDVSEIIMNFVLDDVIHALNSVTDNDKYLKELRSIIRPAVRLGAVNKEFANIVKGSGVWSLVRKRLVEFGVVPSSFSSSVSDTHVVSLCLGRGCQMCGTKGIRKIYWEMGGGAKGCRVCRDCLEENTIENYYIEKEFGVIGARRITAGLPRIEVQSYRPRIGNIILTFFWYDDVFSDDTREKREHARMCVENEQNARMLKLNAQKEAKAARIQQGAKGIVADAPPWIHVFATDRMLMTFATKAYAQTLIHNKTWPPYYRSVLGFVDIVLLYRVETKIHQWMSIIPSSTMYFTKISSIVQVIHEFVSSHEVVRAFPTHFNKHSWNRSEWPDTLCTRAIVKDCVNAIFEVIKKMHRPPPQPPQPPQQRRRARKPYTCVQCNVQSGSHRCPKRCCGSCCLCDKHTRNRKIH